MNKETVRLKTLVESILKPPEEPYIVIKGYHTKVDKLVKLIQAEWLSPRTLKEVMGDEMRP